tara:strand:- start:3937 stop:4575 length:639 start_codon:yes stop_codon:yes gene_type:complete
MGGFGSGRTGGQPTADMSLRIDIAWMLRTRKAVPGSIVWGGLNWRCGGNPSGSISYTADMVDPEHSRLDLSYTRGSGDNAKKVEQCIWLHYTQPHFGGKRWWMTCPYKGIRVGKLYLPNGGDRFASRQAWRLGYHSQRVAHRDRAFEKLFRLQRKLDSPTGFETPLYRPKGMWQRTYDKHLERYWELNEECGQEMAVMMDRLGMFGDRLKGL